MGACELFESMRGPAEDRRAETYRREYSISGAAMRDRDESSGRGGRMLLARNRCSPIDDSDVFA